MTKNKDKPKCPICQRVGFKKHQQLEMKLAKAAMGWMNRGLVKDWRKLEKAALAYGAAKQKEKK